MECDTLQTVIELINNYGYIILFSALVLELIAFPIPGEPMMAYCGFLVYENKLNWITSILVATTGVTLGITISYITGSKLGESFFKKYGSYVHLGPKRLETASVWFNSYGTKLIFLAYFIPGVRHITGYFSGITKLTYKKFALNAYIGALIWTSTFISLGNFLGLGWYKLHDYIKEATIIGAIIITLILIVIYINKKHGNSIMVFNYRKLIPLNFIGTIKIAVVSAAIALLGFIAYYNF